MAAAAAVAAVVLTFVEPQSAHAIDFALPGTVTSQQNTTAARVFDDENKQVYLDISVDREPRGRIVIKLFKDVPLGAARFAALAEGQGGVGYRLSKVDGISDAYIKVGGVRTLTYSATDNVDIAGGDTVEELEAEMTLSSHKHSEAGLVSLQVKDEKPRQVKEKMVAYQGKLVTIQEEVGGQKPNGTGFAITLGAAPQLDATNLVVGQVVEGLDVVQDISHLPVVKANSNSAFFKAAKRFGDRRADVAELGFNKPFSKVIISAAGSLHP
ncbi:hypothetical protein WJX72_005123 [[Myrmecia] bisecta]|uniref:PPIase cyclophilin-type domain-containing protein n=1 Tax=[Myrmecia] bisecta TaxID=41462 RepID=A0AAW1Q490_9CHLO